MMVFILYFYHVSCVISSLHFLFSEVFQASGPSLPTSEFYHVILGSSSAQGP